MEKYYIVVLEPEFEFHEFIRYVDLIEYIIRNKDKIEDCKFRCKIIIGKEL